MSSYSVEDIARMQREAERRVREMQQRNSMRTGAGRDTREHGEMRNQKQPPKKKNSLLDIIGLDKMEMDSDRSMILMMLAMLSECDDELLMLALIYIML